MQAPAAHGSVLLRPDVLYAVHGGVDLFLDAYLPDDGEVHPAVVLIHGGRWTYGARGDLASLAFSVADHGYAAIAVDYRLLPEWTYPAGLEDVRSAVGWVRAHADELRVDPARIGALGGSAGGFLAASLATVGSGERGSLIAAAASWSGPLDLEPLLGIEEASIGLTIARFLGCEGPDACSEEAQRASPSRLVDPGDAPMLVAHADGEKIPVAQALSMASAYERAGIPFELITPEGSGHGMRNAAVLLDPTLRFFDRWLGTSSRQVDERSPRTDPEAEVPGPGAAPISTTDPREPAPVDPWPSLMGAIVLGLGVVLGATTVMQRRIVTQMASRRRARSAAS